METTQEQPSPTLEMAAELTALLSRMRAGETDGIAELDALSTRAPDSLEVLGNLAWALAHKGRHEDSIACCRRYLQLSPENVEMKWRIGDRLVNLGKLDEALAQYRQVQEAHPACEDAKMGVRYVLHLQKQSSKEHRAYIPSLPKKTERQLRNAELNAREFKQQKTHLESLPPSLYLESTTKCNFYCKTCSKGYEAYHAEDLRADIREKVVEELMPTNTRISITGFGEPTLSADFDEILKMGIENGSQVHFVTNASLLNFDRIEKLTRCPVEITISFDGATKQTFEAIRAGSNFDLILDKLGMIKKLRDIHLSTNYSKFVFNFVALRSNIHELAEVVRIAHRYGISRVGVADYAFVFNEFDEQSLRYESALGNQCLAEAEAEAARLGVRLITPPRYSSAPHAGRNRTLLEKIRAAGRVFPQRNRFPGSCTSPWSEPYIHTDGTITPCCASGQKLGDLKNSSFAAIWNGWYYRFLRMRIRGTLPPIACRECIVVWGINGGNVGNVMTKEGVLVKLFYWAEVRARRIASRLTRGGLSFGKKKGNTAATPEPNYHRGRPIKDKTKFVPDSTR
jgi:MoaA/NifB/PqqE/SkfB family radical SAM enzyme